jgi:two-component system, response regulator PdtaR
MAVLSAPTDRPLIAVVAEDEVWVRRLAAEVLQEEGFVTFTAEDAFVALEICKAHPEAIDVLFTDLRIPGPMNGLQLAHHVRQRWPWIGIIVVSGSVFLRQDQLPEGACFLPQPYDNHRMVNVIRQMRELS